MTIEVTALTEQFCKQICSWQYKAPYDIYNWPSWGQMVAQNLQFADVNIREAQFAAVVQTENEASELIGFVQFFPMFKLTRLGLGMRPDLCSNGLGLRFMKAITDEAKRRNPNNEIDLEVRIWNERAKKTYLKAGFELVDEYERMTPNGMESFYCMVYQG
jgi:ribosomal-protein-alanine N-acetyltransferase